MDYRTLAAGTPITLPNGEILLDIEKNRVVAVGSWADPQNINQMASAIKALHIKYKNGGDYTDPCQRCLSLKNRNPPVLSGCQQRHLGQPVFYRQGCPTSSP